MSADFGNWLAEQRHYLRGAPGMGWVDDPGAAERIWRQMGQPAAQPVPSPPRPPASEISSLRTEVGQLRAELAAIGRWFRRSKSGEPVLVDDLISAVGGALGHVRKELLDKVDGLEARMAAEEEASSSTGIVGGLVDRVARLEERPELRFLGSWDASTHYTPGDVVSAHGSTWCCRAANTGTTPSTAAAAIWMLLARRGRDGRAPKPIEPGCA